MSKIRTSEKVYGLLLREHSADLKVFSSYSNPTGRCPIGTGECEMVTTYGLKGSDFPLMQYRVTWQQGDSGGERFNEKKQYYLYVNKRGE